MFLHLPVLFKVGDNIFKVSSQILKQTLTLSW